VGEAGLLALLLTAISAAAIGFCAAGGYTLYDGDAEAHLNIARRVLDSRTPGSEQLGTVWLPLPHVLMLPFVMHWNWWRGGVGGGSFGGRFRWGRLLSVRRGPALIQLERGGVGGRAFVCAQS
jgi:hypothetical protein